MHGIYTGITYDQKELGLSRRKQVAFIDSYFEVDW